MITPSRRFISCTLLAVVMLLCTSNSHAQVDPQSMVGAWLFDEGTGNLAKDDSGHGYDADFRDNPAWTEGIRGQALAFQNGSYLEIRDSSENLGFGGSAHFSVTAWVKNQGGGTVMGKYNAGVIGAFFLQVDSGGIIGFDRESAPWIMYGTQALPNDVFAHVAVTYDGTTLKIYVDGEVDVQQDWGPQSTDTVTPVLIGARHAGGSPTEFFDGVLDEVALFDVALTQSEIKEIMSGLPIEVKASAPVPGDTSTDVFRDTHLSWTPVEGVAKHDVYLGTSFEDVDSATVPDASGLDENAYDPGRLDLTTTYYWRVDEVNSPPDNTVFKGSVWSFTTEPVAYEIEAVTATASSVHAAGMEADRTIDGSGLNADGEHSADLAEMWLSNMAETEGVWVQYDLGKLYKLDHMHVWNHNSQSEMILGNGIKEALIETSTDGETWRELKTAEFAQATGLEAYPGAPVALDSTLAQVVRITALSNYSIIGLKQFGLSEVRFYSIPVLAREPIPADNSTSDDAKVMLQWRAGREADQHEVVFSDDLQAVIDGTAVIATVNNPSFDLGTLDLGTQYYWKVNEINDVETPSSYRADLWTFQTPDEVMIDDFETYQAQEGLRIWEHWIDGFDNPDENGAVVGNGDDPETVEVYEGGQSMPLAYNNTAAPKSEATRTFDPPLDLAAGNPESIEVYIKGIPYVVVGAYSVDGNSWTDLAWNPPVELGDDIHIGLAVTSHDVASVATATMDHVSTTGNVIGDWTQADMGGTHPNENFTEVNGTFTIPAMGADIWGTADEFRYVYKQLSGLGSITVNVESLDGTNAWCKAGVMIRDALVPESSYAFMAATGTNGVRLQSRMSHGASSTQDVDNGGLDGTQELMDEPVWIRIERKMGNGASSIYMTLTDSSGRSATIETEDAAATTVGSWTLLSAAPDNLNVDLSQVESITIGVDASGVEGMIFVDAIRTTKPYPEPAPTE